jgi:glycerophosphoryl diester phosphodiesterase
VQQRLPSLLDPPIAFAHRGARAHAPENTLEAFSLALRLGATGLESDVWLTADDQLVLDHDGVVGGRWRRRALREVTHEELPDHIPTLAAPIETCGTGHHLSLDLKDPDTGAPVIDLVRAVDPSWRRRVWLCSPDLDLLTALRAHDDRIRLVHSTKLERIQGGAERHAARLAELDIDGINLHHRSWTGGLGALFHRFERVAFGWDLQFEHLLRQGLRMGLDAVYSDHVDVMVDAMRAEIGSIDPGG